ncbi:hypothetical protein [uncultured Olleya sp.]|uniref:hypothetical protein n=1 Tax=uncultured Olleya sp. TaxID=757243 RepID=UPI002599E92C|nr:hypothetical protein [uncultured Olleya sp.]
MEQKKKKRIVIISIILTLIVLLFFITKAIIKNKLEQYLSNLPEQIELKYEDLSIGLLSGDVVFDGFKVNLKGQTTGQSNGFVQSKKMSLKGFSYWDYMVNKTINVSSIIANQPEVTYYHNPLASTSKGSQAMFDDIKQKITVDDFKIKNAKIEVFDLEKDSVLLKTENLNFSLSDFIFNGKQTSNTKTPFQFKNVTLKIIDLEYQVNSFETLSFNELIFDNNTTAISDLKLKTKLSKENLSNQLQTERDHFDLHIPKIKIENQDFDFKGAKLLAFSSKNMTISDLNLTIFRDKLVADDLTNKAMYSKMLRDLDIQLDLKAIQIINGSITYQEKVKKDTQAGTLDFKNFNAKLTNVSNTYHNSQTTINIDCIFMENTPLQVNWSFNVNNLQDHFTFKADIGNLKAEALNQFMTPNLNLKLEGDLKQTLFTIDGNAVTSNVDLKTKYNQFDIIILKENGNEKNKLLSGIINLFVSKDSKGQSDNFRKSDTKQVTRDNTKSVFNFIWKNTQSGLISAMAGDGTKEN